MKTYLNILTLSVAMLSTSVHRLSFAEQSTPLNAHLHGLSEITIAIDKQNLEIEIHSPASNIVGFEHRAITPADNAKIKAAKTLLSQPQTLFVFSGGNCNFIEQVIDLSSISSEHHTTNTSEHSHKHHDDNKQIKTNHQADNHSEVSAYYRYQCHQASSISAIDFNMFVPFPGIEKIQAMWITPSQQGSLTLDANNNTVNFN